MELNDLFFQRYDVLYSFWLEGVWEMVPEEQLRQRPHPKVNSIVWNLWHLIRVEDAGLNRFVTDGVQVFEAGGWGEKINLPWRHHGSGMTFAEVDELSARINIPALREYSSAVVAQTRRVMAGLTQADLGATLTEAYVRKIVLDEGLGHNETEGLIANYTGWTKGKCLMNFGMTHPYQHVGEIGVIASLLGVDFD